MALASVDELSCVGDQMAWDLCWQGFWWQPSPHIRCYLCGDNWVVLWWCLKLVTGRVDEGPLGGALVYAGVRACLCLVLDHLAKGTV